jgi:hypothetical protein
MIKTGAQYREDMKRLKPSIYMMGEKVENYQNDPRFTSSFNLVAMNHDMCFEEKYRDLAVAYEPLVDEPVRRFTHKIQRTQEDSVLKARLTRAVSRHHICGWCMSNSLCILWALTYDIDQKYGTEYHGRFKEFAKYLMKNDYDCFWAMMNPKGDRSLKLHQQKQGSPGVKVIKKDKKGLLNAVVEKIIEPITVNHHPDIPVRHAVFNHVDDLPAPSCKYHIASGLKKDVATDGIHHQHLTVAAVRYRQGDFVIIATDGHTAECGFMLILLPSIHPAVDQRLPIRRRTGNTGLHQGIGQPAKDVPRRPGKPLRPVRHRKNPMVEIEIEAVAIAVSAANLVRTGKDASAQGTLQPQDPLRSVDLNDLRRLHGSVNDPEIFNIPCATLTLLGKHRFHPGSDFDLALIFKIDIVL